MRWIHACKMDLNQGLGLGFMKRFSFVFLIFLWGYGLACSGETGSVIRIGIHDYKPFVSVEPDNQAKGIFPEIMEYVAAQEGWKIEYVPGSLGQCLARLENNEIDLVCALAFSEIMDRYYDFNGENLAIDWTRGSETGNADLDPSPFYYAVLQGTNKGLIAAIDGHIKILKSTDNSVYYRSLARWAAPVSQGPPFPVWIKWGLLGVLSLVLVLFLGNLVLRNRVKAKTRTLIRELTRRKQTEAALMESEERFRMLFDEAPDAIFILSLDDTIMDANGAASLMLGYTREEFQTMSLPDLQAPSVRGKKGRVILNELIMGRVFEGLDIHKDGTLVPIEVHNHKTRFKGREIVLSVVRNIAERKQAEEELRVSEERYREYFEENIAGSYIATPGGQLIACNREYQRIFQFATIQEALDTPLPMTG